MAPSILRHGLIASQLHDSRYEPATRQSAAVMNSLGVVAVRVVHEGGVVVGVVDRAEARRTVVGASGGDRRCVEGLDRLVVGGLEGDVNRARRRALADPEGGLALTAEASDSALEFSQQLVAEGLERGDVEVLAARVLADLQADVIDHSASWRSWKTASTLFPSGSST